MNSKERLLLLALAAFLDSATGVLVLEAIDPLARLRRAYAACRLQLNPWNRGSGQRRTNDTAQLLTSIYTGSPGFNWAASLSKRTTLR